MEITILKFPLQMKIQTQKKKKKMFLHLEAHRARSLQDLLPGGLNLALSKCSLKQVDFGKFYYCSGPQLLMGGGEDSTTKGLSPLSLTRFVGPTQYI